MRPPPGAAGRSWSPGRATPGCTSPLAWRASCATPPRGRWARAAGAGPIDWRRRVLALGSRPNDFAIPGLAQRTLSLYSADDAERVWDAVSKALTAAAAAADPGQQRRLATVVVGGGGATGVELAGGLAAILPPGAGAPGP